MHKAWVWRPVLSSDMSRAVLWVFKAQALTWLRFVYEATSLFEWKRQPDKSHVALNQWPVLRRHNCLFTASSKSILAFPSQIHPYRYHADSGCLAAAVLELFLLSLFFVFVTDGQQSRLLYFYQRGDRQRYQCWLQSGSHGERWWRMSSIWEAQGQCKMLKFWILRSCRTSQDQKCVISEKDVLHLCLYLVRVCCCLCICICTDLQPSACIQPGCRSSSHILHWAGRLWWWPTGSWQPAEHSLPNRAPRWSEEHKHRTISFQLHLFTETLIDAHTGAHVHHREQILLLWKSACCCHVATNRCVHVYPPVKELGLVAAFENTPRSQKCVFWSGQIV